VVETTQRQLAKDCPECGEVLQTIIPIAQQDNLNQTHQVLALLQNQFYHENISPSFRSTLNAVFSEMGLQAMPAAQVQNTFDGLPRLSGISLKFIAVDDTLQTQFKPLGLEMGSGNSLPAPRLAIPVPAESPQNRMAVFKKFL